MAEDNDSEIVSNLRTKNAAVPEDRITDGTALCLILVAAFFDGLQAANATMGLVPLVGIIASLTAVMIWWFAFGTFWLWFHILGITFFDSVERAGWKALVRKMGKYTARLVIPGTSFIVGFIPFLGPLMTGIVPEWVISVGLMILIVKAEDKDERIKSITDAARRLVLQQRWREEEAWQQSTEEVRAAWFTEDIIDLKERADEAEQHERAASSKQRDGRSMDGVANRPTPQY